jgi:hypothetical protein
LLNVANKIVACIDEPPQPLEESVYRTIKQRLDIVKAQTFPEEVDVAHTTADKQVDDLREYFRAALPYENSGYPAVRKSLEAVLTARKNTRDFQPVQWGSTYDRYMDDQDSKKRGECIATVAMLSLHQQYMRHAITVGWTNSRPAHVKTRMGDESVLETSISSYKTYGVLSIPGSALKGLAASYARRRLSKDWQKSSDAYQVLFGSTEEAGSMTFCDALSIPGTGRNG